VAEYLLVANRLGFGEQALRPNEVIKTLLPNRLWLLPETAPLVRKFAAGDRFLIYAGGESAFYAVAEGSGPPTGVDMSIVPQHFPGLGGFFQYMLRFREVTMFTQPVSAAHVLDRLSFVKDRRYWGLYFRHSVRRISRRDFDLIVRHALKRRRP